MTSSNTCPDCGLEMQQTVLLTGTYTFCDPCQNKVIEQNMKSLRSELRAKGYDI